MITINTQTEGRQGGRRPAYENGGEIMSVKLKDGRLSAGDLFAYIHEESHVAFGDISLPSGRRKGQGDRRASESPTSALIPAGLGLGLYPC